MTVMEIVLLVIGCGMFVASFFIPDKGGADKGKLEALSREEINRLVEEKMKEVKGNIDDVVEEAVAYSMEKTERSLERLTNEKIMAVGDYSDTVLKEINRNHDEVMFLYDMLSDKHNNLKDTVTKATKAAKEMEETTKDAEAIVNDFQKLGSTLPVAKETPKRKKAAAPKPVPVEAPVEEKEPEEAQNATPELDTLSKRNRVLALHEEGKTNVAIAKELGVGTGEVKLILELYKNQ